MNAQRTSLLVAVVGPPGCGGEFVAAALASAGAMTDASPALTSVADGLLGAMRAARHAPPELDSGWDDEPELRELEAVARAAVPDGDAVWFDSATALVLPFWRNRLSLPDVVVIASRNPSAASARLQREGMSAVHALALWEHAMLSALTAPAGLPVVVVDVDQAQADPAMGAKVLAEVFALAGRDLAPTALDDLRSAIDAAREPAFAAPPVPGSDVVASRIIAAAQRALGAHPSWDPPADLELGPWTTALLDAQRAAHRAALEAIDAWLAVKDAQADAEIADRSRFLELQREAWRLRDELIGMEAERATMRSTMMVVDGAWHAAEHRAQVVSDRLVALDLDALEDARRDRDAMLASRQWKVGRLVVGPLRRLRGWARPG